MELVEMSNYKDFMDALRAERQHQLRQQAAQGLNQRHLLKPDTRLVPLPPNPVKGFFDTQPAWISQIDSLLFTPELDAAIKEQERASRVHQSLLGQAQRVTKEQLITKRAMRRLNYLDNKR